MERLISAVLLGLTLAGAAAVLTSIVVIILWVIQDGGEGGN